MREALGILGSPVDILSHIDSLPVDEQVEARLAIQQVEYNSMVKMIPQPGIDKLFQFLSSEGIKKTICTRNLIDPVNHLLNLTQIQIDDPIVTRSFLPTKPAPEPLLHIIEKWGLTPQEVIMVGDSKDDMLSGLRAGCSVILIKHDNNKHLPEVIPQINFVIDTLDEIIGILDKGFPLNEQDPTKLD